MALFARFSIKGTFTCRFVGIKKEEKTERKDDAKKSEKDGKDEKEGKEKDEQKAGSSDRSRASKSGNSSCLSEMCLRILVLKNKLKKIGTKNISDCDEASTLHPKKFPLSAR